MGVTANRPLAPSQPVEWAPHAEATPIEHVEIGHRGGHVGMAQKLLNRPDVVTALEQVRGKRVPHHVWPNVLRNPGGPRRGRNGPLHDGLVQVIPTGWPPPRVPTDSGGRKHELPAPLPGGVRILPIERERQHDRAETDGKVLVVLALHSLQMLRESWLGGEWQDGAAVLLTLAPPHHDLVAFEIKIFDA